MTRVVEVAAAILLREGGSGTEFLLAQRPEGKVYAGYWEFPGGKVEPGENLREALQRELHEELNICVDKAWPWLSCEFTYPHAHVRIKFFRVTSWGGELVPREHSGLAWTVLGQPAPVSPILPANGPILRSLALPPVYALTNAFENGVDNELVRLKAGINDGLRLIQVRDKTLSSSERRRLASGVMALTKVHKNALVLINDDEALAQDVGAHGLHLSSERLMKLSRRPAFDWVASSCHGSDELQHSAALGLDFALLSPVLPTPSHPEAWGMGWEEFSRLTACSPLPVFALGGMKTEMLENALKNGAHGIAMLRGW